MPIVRGVLVLLAALICAWCVLGARQAHDVSRATSIIEQPGPLSDAAVAHARSLLHAASGLNPDRQIDILRARLELDLGHRAEAEQILRAVVKDEPRSVTAWAWIARAAPDRATFRLGLARVKQLVPSVPPPP